MLIFIFGRNAERMAVLVMVQRIKVKKMLSVRGIGGKNDDHYFLYGDLFMDDTNE